MSRDATSLIAQQGTTVIYKFRNGYYQGIQIFERPYQFNGTQTIQFDIMNKRKRAIDFA
jgi:hypothetical protein